MPCAANCLPSLGDSASASSKATRLAAAASDHAKDVTRNTGLELLVGLNGSASAKELCFDFAATHSGTDAFLQRGFDRVEPMIEGEPRGWRASCRIDPIVVSDTAISWCQTAIAEQSVEELVEALHANNQALQAAKEAEEGARARLSLLLGAAPVVVYSFRASGDFAPTFVSDSIQGMLGYRPEEYLKNADLGRDVSILKTSPKSKLSRPRYFRRDSIWPNIGCAKGCFLLLGQ